MKKYLISLFLLALIFPSGYANTAKEREMSLFLTLGQSEPLGDFKDDVKSVFNWGGGIEFRLSPDWSVGTSISKVDLKHKKIFYDAWSFSYTYTDWGITRLSFWGKYFFIKKSFSPFLKFGLGVYFMEHRTTSIYKEELHYRGQEDALSIVPGAGFEYRKKRFRFFLEADYNIVPTEASHGDVRRIRGTQFFDFRSGVGLSILRF